MTETSDTPDPQDGTLNGEPLDEVPDPTADTEGMGDDDDGRGAE
jgi:hypothetical protein